MDRYWLLTSTFYGNWLPGDERGFVGKVRDASGVQAVHNIPGTPYDADMPRLAEFAANRLKCPPIGGLGDDDAVGVVDHLVGQFLAAAPTADRFCDKRRNKASPYTTRWSRMFAWTRTPIDRRWNRALFRRRRRLNRGGSHR